MASLDIRPQGMSAEQIWNWFQNGKKPEQTTKLAAEEWREIRHRHLTIHGRILTKLDNAKVERA